MIINKRNIGRHYPPYIVIELGSGHGGKIEAMMDLIDAAHRAGADAVKLQVYTPDSLTIDHPFPILEGTWAGYNLWNLYEEALTPDEWLPELFGEADTKGITMFATPFAPKDVHRLQRLDCPAYKVASCEIAHYELLEAIRETGKPVFLSTGMASDEEISNALGVIARDRFDSTTCLMHCISGYPTPVEQANLGRIDKLENEFVANCVGFSDHTPGSLAATMAVALGASVIEKHVSTFNGHDSEFAMRAYELKGFVQSVRDAWLAMQQTEAICEEPTLSLRRSIYAVRDIAAGELFTKENVAVIRPAGGLHPREFARILGRKVTSPIKRGSPITYFFGDSE